MSRYVVAWAGAHSDALRAEGPFPTLAAAMAAIRLRFAVSDALRAAICRTREVDGEWFVYSTRADRSADRFGDAPHLPIASIKRAPTCARAPRELSW